MEKLWYTPDLQLFGGGVAENGNGETGERDADAGQNGTGNVDLEKEFSQLISGKFKDQFTKKTQSIIDKRFKQTKLLEEYKSRVSPVVSSLMEKYGVAEGEEEMLLEKCGIQDAESGMDESDVLNDEASIENENVINEETEDHIETKNAERLRNRISGWLKESGSIKETYPDFDLRNELRSSKLFSQLVLSGAPLRAAYEIVHKDEILSGAMAYTADKVREQVVKNIETKGRRPLENGISSESAVVTAVDVNALTSKDILKILKQVENGANIKF